MSIIGGTSNDLDLDTYTVYLDPRFDWKVTPEAHVFKVNLPELKKEEVKVEVEEGSVLKISGEWKKEEEEKTDIWHHIERSSGSFLRSFRLPENTKADDAKATMENGVLTVTVKKRVVKSIEISDCEERKFEVSINKRGLFF